MPQTKNGFLLLFLHSECYILENAAPTGMLVMTININKTHQKKPKWKKILTKALFFAGLMATSGPVVFSSPFLCV